MKKTLLYGIVASFACFTQISIAQSSKFSVGLLAGYQMSYLVNQNDSDEGPELDYGDPPAALALGVSLAYHISPKFAIGVDPLFVSKQGMNYTQELTGGTGTIKMELNYTKIPLLFKFNTNPDAKVVFTAYAGPQISLLGDNVITAISKGIDGSSQVKTLIDREFNLSINGTTLISTSLDRSAFKSSTFGGVIGLGAQINFGKFFLTPSIRADYDFTDAEEKEASYTVAGEKKYILKTGSLANLGEPNTKDRSKTHNITAGFFLNLGYKF
ncbi:MAG: PorT family protein [Saprospiraceae bacterium]|nr:PorT family protein [Saprospiraceae bacterium]